MALWKEIVTLYPKENIYLGEGAQLLTQAVSYDVPGIVDINCYLKFKLTCLLREINLFGFESIARKNNLYSTLFQYSLKLLKFYAKDDRLTHKKCIKFWIEHFGYFGTLRIITTRNTN
jgi:hypothetical protein